MIAKVAFRMGEVPGHDLGVTQFPTVGEAVYICAIVATGVPLWFAICE